MNAAYRYRAVDAAGANSAGVVIAGSRAGALEELAKRGLIPTELWERADTESNKSSSTLTGASWLKLRRSDKMTSRELLELSQSLTSLLNAGLMVDRALQIATQLAESESTKRVADSLLKSVRSGQTLSRAFTATAEEGLFLPPYFISMVEAGEIGGSLPATFARLVDIQRRDLEIREKVGSALIYPSMLAAVMVVTVVLLFSFVLPRFEQLFSDSEVPLPFSMKVILGLRHFLVDWWWLVIAMAVIAVSTFSVWTKSPAGRLWFDGWMLRSRVTFGLPALLNTARLFRTISTLTANGLPLPAALRVSKGTVVNLCLLDALGQVTRDVQAGEALSQALAKVNVFPQVAKHFSRVGEETGRLDELLMAASQVLEDEAHRKLERLLTMFVPLLTLVMGLMVAGLIGSVLVGLLSINDLAM